MIRNIFNRLKEKSNRRKITFAVLLISIVILLVYLVSAVFELSTDERKKNIVFIPKLIDDNNEFWTSLIDGTELAAEEYDINLTVVAPEREEYYELQNELIDWAIEQNPDAIVIAPSHYTATLANARKVKEHGIELVFVDSYVEEHVEDILIATDNFKTGEKLGQYMKKFINDDTKIAIISYVKTASTAIERQAGLRSGLGKDEEKVVDVVYCDSEFHKSFALTKELFEKHDDISMIVGLNEYSAVGATRAIIDMNIIDEIKVFGFDSSVEQIQYLESNIYQGLMIQKPFNMGYLGIEQAVKLINGEDVEDYIDSKSELITKENMYTKENQKLLFPFIR